MKCGEFNKRNQSYSDIYSDALYFTSLIYGSSLSGKSPDGSGMIIFDVGSHKGESALFFKKIFPSIEIHSFEPNSNASVLHKNLNIKGNYVYNIALSDFDGNADFFEQDISHLSSLVKINRSSKSSLGYAKKETHKQTKVSVQQGDSFVTKYNFSKIDLLKVDVQANEINTLYGFKKSLRIIKNIMVETSLYDFYEKKSSIGAIESVLKGFYLYDIHEVSKNPKTLGTDWVNLVYKNCEIFP